VLAAGLQDRQGGSELVQFGHAVGARTLAANYRHEVAGQLTGLECVKQRILGIEHPRRSADGPMLGRHRRHLDHGTAQIALQQAQPTLGRKRFGYRAHDLGVERNRRRLAPGQPAAVEPWFAGLIAQASAVHAADVRMQQAGVDQFANHQAQAAGGVEVVYIGAAVGINATEQRGGPRQIVEVGPVDADAGGPRDGDQMDGVVGRAAGGRQSDHRVDDGLLVDRVADRRVVLAERGNRAGALGGRHGQCIAQRRVRVDEGGAGQMQAHHFHQHLVGVGGAVKRAGAGAVVGLRLGVEQFLAAGLALGVKVADTGLFLVGDARGHRPGRNEDHRQMPETECADQQARHDLVAHAQHHRSVEHLVRQRHGGGQGDGVAREQ